MYPTLRQKLHFMWLVVMNADRMLRRCHTHGEVSRLIDSATNRRASLGLPMHRISDSRKTRQLAQAVSRNTGIGVVEEPELDFTWEPY